MLRSCSKTGGNEYITGADKGDTLVCEIPTNQDERKKKLNASS